MKTSSNQCTRCIRNSIINSMVLLLVGLSTGLHAQVLPGVEVLVRDYGDQLKGHNVAILTNPTGVTRELESTIDVVRAIPGVNVVRLFSPEHGLRGQHFAGEKIDETRDPVSGIPVASLYGKTRKPTAQMLEGLDLVIYDIQDVGHRSYTFVSTLTLLMEACESAGVAVWVLDRPDPMGGKTVGGPMLDPDLLSFIGIHDVPQVYGMTPGEWRLRYRELRRGLEYEEKALEDAQAELSKIASTADAWTLAAPIPGGGAAATDAPLDYQLRQEIKRHKAEVEHLERALRELDVRADLAGVPAEWRQ